MLRLSISMLSKKERAKLTQLIDAWNENKVIIDHVIQTSLEALESKICPRQLNELKSPIRLCSNYSRLISELIRFSSPLEIFIPPHIIASLADAQSQYKLIEDKIEALTIYFENEDEKLSRLASSPRGMLKDEDMPPKIEFDDISKQLIKLNGWRKQVKEYADEIAHKLLSNDFIYSIIERQQPCLDIDNIKFYAGSEKILTEFKRKLDITCFVNSFNSWVNINGINLRNIHASFEMLEAINLYMLYLISHNMLEKDAKLREYLPKLGDYRPVRKDCLPIVKHVYAVVDLLDSMTEKSNHYIERLLNTTATSDPATINVDCKNKSKSPHRRQRSNSHPGFFKNSNVQSDIKQPTNAPTYRQ
jgi:hypothetical protein